MADNVFGPLLFWAKLSRKSETPRPFHPLACHMVDVALVAHILWHDVLPPAARRQIARALEVEEGDAGHWLTFWSGLHDIGKASPAFQLQDDSARARLQRAGLHCPSLPMKAHHGAVTAAVLPAILKDAFRLSGDLASRVATIVGGHHGVFPRSSEVNDARPAAGKDDWEVARREVAQGLANVLGLPAIAPAGTLDNATAMALAGLVSVADWVGSNEDYFPYAVQDPMAPLNVDFALYAEKAANRARAALCRLAWLNGATSTERLSFAALFPDCAVPRPVQLEVVSLAEKLDGPSLVVVEAPMGEGKTEAAIYVADNAGTALGQGGCYFALPTQATSNQMFGRVRDFLARRYADGTVQLQLLHGHAALSAEFELLKDNAYRIFEPHAVYDEKGEHGTSASAPNVVAAEWFTHRKRGLLAPFGVGTVDQALLAVLQTRHVFVRLFGLAHKTVILDEVHAYDTYMSTLLERLLEWLGALGSSVVVLSATLPRARRENLVNAYAKGLGRKEASLPVVDYPRVSWVSRTAQGVTHVEASQWSTKEVQLEWVDGQLPEATGEGFGLGQRLQAALAGGGCAALICNTVGRAQQMYRALKPYFPCLGDDGLPELDLFHARFLFEERERREKRALVRFGKPGGKVQLQDGTTAQVRRPHRAVLVATQVIEQSLDLDFDLMVTDLAPADLVLQRAGRLHRHEWPRPPCLETPTLWVCRVEEIDGVPKFDSGTEAVYDKHILLRSWLELKDRRAVHVPGDVEDIIEAVYDDRKTWPEGSAEGVRHVWQDSRQKLLRKREDHEALGRQLRVLPPNYPDDILEDFNRELEEDDPTVHRSVQALTRLGDPSIGVVILDSQRHLDPAAKLSMLQVKDLLGRSVTVSHKCLVHVLLQQEVPHDWRQSPLLRHHRLVELDADSSKVFPGYRLHYDNELGLSIERIGEEENDA